MYCCGADLSPNLPALGTYTVIDTFAQLWDLLESLLLQGGSEEHPLGISLGKTPPHERLARKQ